MADIVRELWLGLYKGKCTTSLLPTLLVILWSCPGTTHFPHTPHFGLGQNSITIKRVGHGWVLIYHFETRTIKGIYPFMGQTRYYCPLMGGSAITITFSLSPSERSPSSPRILFLISHSPILCLLCYCYCHYPVSLLTPSILPHVHFLLARASSSRFLSHIQ